MLSSEIKVMSLSGAKTDLYMGYCKIFGLSTLEGWIWHTPVTYVITTEAALILLWDLGRKGTGVSKKCILLTIPGVIKSFVSSPGVSCLLPPST